MPQVILNTQHIATASFRSLSLSLSLSVSISICAAGQSNSGLGHLIAEVLRSHATGKIPVNDDQMFARMQQQTRGTNIHVLSGIRTCDPSNKEAADLTSHGHRTGTTASTYTNFTGPLPLSKNFSLTANYASVCRIQIESIIRVM